jgi:hypothetical protein
VITFDLSSENLVSILGALFDIVGATLLAWALVFVKPRAIVLQSSSGYGFNPILIKMFAEQKVDAAYGLGILVVGFFLQGAAGYGYKSTSYIIFGIGLAGLLGALTSYWYLRRRFTELIFKRACRSQKSDDGSPRHTDARIAEFWSNAGSS